MASIKSYKNKNGDKLYRIQLYGGLNPQTGKVQRINRRGFKSKKKKPP